MSFKLLEISILSAQDLAPVSKLLRTYAVAWVHPDHKLTTTVDHRSSTNPTWNYRFVFPVDDHLLSAAILTVQIFNVSWLRHIPVGTANALVTTLLPTPSSSGTRFLSLKIRRPSGALHGTLHLGVNLIGSARPVLPLNREIAASTTTSGNKRSREEREIEEEEEEKQENAKIRKLWRSRSDRNDESSVFSGEFGKSEEEKQNNSKNGNLWRSRSDRSESVFIYDESSVFSGRFCKSKGTPGSISSYYMRPLPSEVAADMAKGLYSTTLEEDIGSSILENWTVVGDVGEFQRTKSKVVRWKNADEYGPAPENNLSKKKSNGWGLLSCFGTLCGYQCNIVCGVPQKKKNKNMKKFGANQSAANLRLMYR
ncbi:hypothetical protein CEY00_Acc20887 [Actinidia chinensis var. chinensis]|uniref:C2 domain-containing protein n=1 Tax=Actinidia chinensis var. chinensis TaxID=1590841 RepID=A0A2R6QAW8_ACTCC|nr:hypothetical protein CEY00_Acc20887 [Actinidia chinensis var. chinensis]